jgi:hypothetical protein
MQALLIQVCLKSGSEGVGINSNFGDTATLSNIKTSGKPSATNVCCTYEGVSKGNEPPKIGWYVLTLCCNTKVWCLMFLKTVVIATALANTVLLLLDRVKDNTVTVRSEK